MKNIYRLLLIAVTLFSCSIVTAQNIDTTGLQRNENGKISFAHVLSNTKMADAISFLRVSLQMANNDSFELEKETTDKLNMTHQRYQQYYKGIKVENAEYMLHGKNGIINTINGDFQIVNIASVIPALSEQQALTDALNYVNVKEYKWQDSASEKFIKITTNNPNATYYPNGELVIARDYLKGGKNLLLSWKFSISSLNPYNKQMIYVDANTGEIIDITPQLLDTNIPLTAQTKYSGTLGITGDSYLGSYRLREVRNGVNMETLNLNGTYNYLSAPDFTNGSTNWIIGSWPNITQDQQALDAHWGAEKVLDFWKTVFNRNSLNGNGLAIMSYVHNPVGGDAYWDGTEMNYGDGNSTFSPLTSLDVCAHETGHGICQYTANLAYVANESSALNEGFSDIWGACVENWAAPNKQTWLIGEDITKVSPYYLRSLSNPKSSMSGEGTVDTYHGINWSYSTDPSTYAHENMSVLSHWFYLLSQGSSGTNDNSNSYSVTGIGISKAEEIAWRTESVYLTSSANYAATRTASIQAAIDLYCANSPEVAAVTNAWYAVGVGAAYAGSVMSVSGSSNICTSNTYTVINQPTGIASIVWSTGTNYIATINTVGVAAKVGNDTTTIYATVTGNTGCTTTVPMHVYVGVPVINSTYTDNSGQHAIQYWTGNPSSYNSVCNSYNANTNMGIIGANTVTWSKVTSSPSSISWYQNVNDISFYFWQVNQTAVFKIDASNTCGTTTNTFGFKSIDCSGGGGGCDVYQLSPNPATNSIQVGVIPDIPAPCGPQPMSQSTGQEKTSSMSKTGSTNNRSIQSISIYDNTGTLRQQHQYAAANKQATLNVSNLPSGIYIVRIKDGAYIENHRLVIGK